MPNGINGNGSHKLPYFSFYPKDFCQDSKVRLMTFEQKGIYIELLCVAWEQDPPGTLPDDNVVLAKYLGLLPEYWARHRATVLAAFYPGEDGRWHQKRMEQEAAKARDRVLLATAAAAARWKRGTGNASASNADALPRASDSDSDSPSSSEGKCAGKPHSSSLKRRPATAGEVEAFVVAKLKLTRNDALALWEHWLGNGFRNNGRAMANWQATASNWARRGWFFPSLQPTKREFNR
jgi:uncharacterized protein YdaU (DUF1376 family)